MTHAEITAGLRDLNEGRNRKDYAAVLTGAIELLERLRASAMTGWSTAHALAVCDNHPASEKAAGAALAELGGQ